MAESQNNGLMNFDEQQRLLRLSLRRRAIRAAELAVKQWATIHLNYQPHWDLHIQKEVWELLIEEIELDYFRHRPELRLIPTEGLPILNGR